MLNPGFSFSGLAGVAALVLALWSVWALSWGVAGDHGLAGWEAGLWIRLAVHPWTADRWRAHPPAPL
jgi:hypothetical protein